MPLASLDHQPITAREEDRSNLIKLEDLLEHLEPSTISSQLISTSGEAIDLPQPVLNLLRQMVHGLLQGNSVTFTKCLC